MTLSFEGDLLRPFLRQRYSQQLNETISAVALVVEAWHCRCQNLLVSCRKSLRRSVQSTLQVIFHVAAFILKHFWCV